MKITGWPMCARCHKPVDDVTSVSFMARYVFTVRCHGDEETSELTLEDLQNATGDIRCGEAFASSRIGAEVK